VSVKSGSTSLRSETWVRVDMLLVGEARGMMGDVATVDPLTCVSSLSLDCVSS
jgi:hypothetical protein